MDIETISLTALKIQIIEKYGLSKQVCIKMLKYSENITYFVGDEINQRKYALRLCRLAYHDREELESEMIWIAAVKQTTDICVADPVCGSDGSYVQEVTLQNQNTYYCTLFSFLEGEPLRALKGSDLKKYIAKLGTITAKLHHQALNWPPAKNGTLKRFCWTEEDFFGDTARWGRWQDFPGITARQHELYSRTEAIIKDQLLQYGKSPDRFGLIHTDLNINNIIVKDSRIQVLDFDDCGYGWLLYDMSTTLLEYEGETLYTLLQAWLAGYEQVRSLSEADYQQIITFLMLRRLVRIAWIGTHADNDTVKNVPVSYYDETEHWAALYCGENCIRDYSRFFEKLCG